MIGKHNVQMSCRGAKERLGLLTTYMINVLADKEPVDAECLDLIATISVEAQTFASRAATFLSKNGIEEF